MTGSQFLGFSPSLPSASSLKLDLAPFTTVVLFVPRKVSPCPADGMPTAVVGKLPGAARSLPSRALSADCGMAREGLLDRILS